MDLMMGNKKSFPNHKHEVSPSENKSNLVFDVVDEAYPEWLKQIADFLIISVCCFFNILVIYWFWILEIPKILYANPIVKSN